MLLRELKRRFSRFAGPSLLFCIIFYFAYHIVQGDRGLLAWHRLDQKSKEAAQHLSVVKIDHDQLENRVRLLRPESLCLDLLSEQVKKMLGLTDPNEYIVLRTEGKNKKLS